MVLNQWEPMKESKSDAKLGKMAPILTLNPIRASGNITAMQHTHNVS